MRKPIKNPCVLIFCLATLVFAVATPDFSGIYVAEQKESGKGTAPPTTLRAVQTEVAIEVERVFGGKSVTNRFPLDGSEGDYITATGLHGKCKAKLKNGTLVLESLVAVPTTPNGPSNPVARD